MDYELLVADRIQDGRALVTALVGERIVDVVAAFWVKPTGINFEYFYLASQELSSKKVGDAFHILHSTIYRMEQSSLLLSEIKIISPSDPIARDAIAFRDQQPRDLPTLLRGCRLGDLEVDEMYIYPRIASTLSRQDVVQRVAALLSREGDPGSTSITLKDGSSIRAVPTSIRRDVPGGVRIVLHDLASDTDRTISVDEVVGIN